MPIAQFAGLASGIDSAALIDAIVEAREVQNEFRRQEISFLESENEALEELNTQILALNDLIDQFRTINGGGVSKTTSSSDPGVAGAVAGSNATNTTYSLDVTSLAKSGTQSFYNSGSQYTSSSSVISTAGSGNIVVNVGTGGDQVTSTIAVTSNVTTIGDFVDSFNADANVQGRASASLVNVGTEASPNYEVVITTLEEGVSLGTISIAPDVALTDVSTSTADQATDAQFTISGINGTITRDTNTVSDVVTGLTFNLLATGSTTVTVSNDADTTADQFGEIVDAFNEVIEFISENDTVTRIEDGNNVTNVYGTLAKTQVDDDLLNMFRTQLAAASSSNGTSVTSLANLGISTNRDGTLSFDSDKFKEGVNNDPTGAGEVLTDFADNTAGTAGILNEFTKFQGFIDVAQDTNNNQIDNLGDSIAQLERTTEKLRGRLTTQFTRLESVVGQLQSQQAALTNILAGL